MCTRHKLRGISLIELIMFIVIVSVALVGILAAMNNMTLSSSDPLVRKQALAIAESLLEEVELMPFTFCDRDDPVAETAADPGVCTVAEGIGPEGVETRHSATSPFDNVSDYHGSNMGPGAIMDITNTNIGVNGYSTAIVVAQQAITGIPATESLLITVTVTGPNAAPVVVEGIRTRYSPRGF